MPKLDGANSGAHQPDNRYCLHSSVVTGIEKGRSNSYRPIRSRVHFRERNFLRLAPFWFFSQRHFSENREAYQEFPYVTLSENVFAAPGIDVSATRYNMRHQYRQIRGSESRPHRLRWSLAESCQSVLTGFLVW